MPSGAGFAAVVAVCAAVCTAEPTMQHDDRPITPASSKDPVAPTDAMVETAVAKLLSGMTVEEKARQLVIEDAIGCCVTNGYFNASKAAAFFGTVGAGVLDSAGRNVDPALMNQIQVGASGLWPHSPLRRVGLHTAVLPRVGVSLCASIQGLVCRVVVRSHSSLHASHSKNTATSAHGDLPHAA